MRRSQVRTLLVAPGWRLRWLLSSVGSEHLVYTEGVIGSSPIGATICPSGGMVDTLVLGTSCESSEGSSPFSPTRGPHSLVAEHIHGKDEVQVRFSLRAPYSTHIYLVIGKARYDPRRRRCVRKNFRGCGKAEICQLIFAEDLRKRFFDTFHLLYPTLIARAELTVARAEDTFDRLICSYGRNPIWLG